jgi:cytolysin (calcineurin-like family phosphatase)
MLIKLDQRIQKAVDVQALLTRYGCNVKMRLGLHEAGDVCSNQGLILLQLTGEGKELKQFEKELNEIEGVKAKMVGI